MNVYKVEAVISGLNDNPETRVERIIADGWQEVHELMARICRDSSWVMREMKIVEVSGETPFSYKTALPNNDKI